MRKMPIKHKWCFIYDDMGKECLASLEAPLRCGDYCDTCGDCLYCSGVYCEYGCLWVIYGFDAAKDRFKDEPKALKQVEEAMVNYERS